MPERGKGNVPGKRGIPIAIWAHFPYTEYSLLVGRVVRFGHLIETVPIEVRVGQYRQSISVQKKGDTNAVS